MIKNRHLFPGGNTADGFANYFAGIIPAQTSNRRLHVLKGGPGVGKNTFMRACAKAAGEAGYSVEYFHCASDPDSLDAVRVPEMGWTMLDGTAPHVIDPVLPGAADGIINLGIYLDESKLTKNRRELEMLFAQNKVCYQSAFAYLGAAGILVRHADTLVQPDLSDILSLVYDEIVKRMEFKGRKANVRRLFASAISPQGIVDYLEPLAQDHEILELMGPKAVASAFIKCAQSFAIQMGYDCEIFDSPLLPGEPECMILPDCNLCITAEQVPGEKRQLDLTPLLKMPEYASTVFAYNERQANDLIAQAIQSLACAKTVHDQIEAFYTESMDYDGLNAFVQSFVDTLPFV